MGSWLSFICVLHRFRLFFIMANGFVKFLSFLNMCTGVCVFVIQIASLARYSSQSMEQVGVGIWGGASYIVTGTVHWISASKEKSVRLYNRFEVATAIISFVCAIVMVGVFAAAIQYIVNDWYCAYRFVRKDHCTVEKGLDGAMLFGGLLALIVNGTLSFIACYCTK